MFQHKLLGVPVWIWIAFFGFADLMLAFPRIDLVVARDFYTPGSGFAAKGQPWEQLAYWSVPVLMVVVNLGLVLAWRLKRMTGRGLAFLLCLLTLVPGLIVNQVFKEHWGRPRPVQVVELGGNRQFAPPFVPSDQGGGSFSSGHVAAAAYVVAVAAYSAGPRSLWTLAACLYALLVALARMAAGAHFLSDALTSVLLVLIGYLMLHRAFFGRERPAARLGEDRDRVQAPSDLGDPP